MAVTEDRSFLLQASVTASNERVRLGEALADAVADLDELPEARPMTASSSASFQSEDFISAVIFVQVRISH